MTERTYTADEVDAMIARAVAAYIGGLNTTPPAAPPAPVQEPLSFNCSAGCGACGVKLQDFVTHQTQSQEGDEWVVVGTQPQIVSTCCGLPVEVWDKRKQDITASVEATPPAAPVQPVASLKEADVIMIAEAHGIDPNTKGLYGFYIDCISSQPAAQPAPVHFAWMRYEEDCAGDPVLVLSRSTEEGAFRVYKEPAQRQWVGLTDEEIEACDCLHVLWTGDEDQELVGTKDFARAIEAKIKELNT